MTCPIAAYCREIETGLVNWIHRFHCHIDGFKNSYGLSIVLKDVADNEKKISIFISWTTDKSIDGHLSPQKHN